MLIGCHFGDVTDIRELLFISCFYGGEVGNTQMYKLYMNLF